MGTMTRLLRRLTSVLFAAAVSVAAPAAVADFNAGFSAYVSGDYRTALHEWLPLAEAGDAEAQFGIGMMHQFGRGVAQDLAEAATWYRRAAEQGSIRAQMQLAGMYARGDGIGRDWAEAVAWWRKAADRGSARAQFHLGEAYQYGNGVERDLEAAERWYGEAVVQGYSRAQAKLEEVVRLQREEGAAVAALATGQEGAEAASETAEPPRVKAAPENIEAAPGAAVSGQVIVLPLVLPEPTKDETTEAEAPPEPPYRIHLASFPSVDDAEAGWRRLVRVGGELLAPLEPAFERVVLGHDLGTVYHLRAGPLADAESARALCETLAERDVRCTVVAPE